MYIANEVYRKTGHTVYVDASTKKTLRDHSEGGRGRPAANLGERPDITVWNRSANTLRAAIELKRTMNFAPVAKDADRLMKSLKGDRGPKSAYMVVYVEAKSAQTVKKRLTMWPKKLGWRLLQYKVDNQVNGERDEPWHWGIGLMRT